MSAPCRRSLLHPASLRALAVLGLAASVAAAPLRAEAQPAAAPIEIDVASTFPSSLPLVGQGALRMMQQVEIASGGTLKLRFREPGVLVPAAQTVDAVASGKVEAAFAGAGWFAGRDSAFNMFSTVPFGPGVGEYLGWMYHGGGLELARGLFRAHGVHNIPCAVVPPEASGWFRREIRKVEDLKGLRMRFFGLGARVMQRLGVETLQLAPGEIVPAMEQGTLDAAEFSAPTMDLPLGFDRVAKYYYFPGWHQQATLFDLYIATSRWDRLAPAHQALIELACSDAIRELIASAEANQGAALREFQSRGVQLRRWSPEILVAFEDSWRAVVEAEVKKNPSFAKVWASYEAFRTNHAIWRRLSRLEQ